MAFTIEPHEGRWVVLQDGVPVFLGDYRQVEDWLDQAENSASGEQQADEPTKASGPMPPRRSRRKRLKRGRKTRSR
jgi:hypothetical protein